MLLSSFPRARSAHPGIWWPKAGPVAVIGGIDVAGSVLVSGARTPMGRLLGSLKGFTAPQLGGIAIKAALERAGLPGSAVNYVILGQVLQAGAGQLPARQAAVAGGIPMDVPAIT